MSKQIPLFMILILAVVLTACSGQATPITPTADIQSTAISAASTIIAATQMALPTATLVPTPTNMPTPIPLPTFAPELSTPTPLPLLIQPSPTATRLTNSGDECNRVLAVAEAGPTAPVRLQNLTNGVALVSLYLNKNTFGQCGYMPETIVKGAATVYLPTGNWYFYALIDYGKGKSGNAYGNFIVEPGSTTVVKILKK